MTRREGPTVHDSDLIYLSIKRLEAIAAKMMNHEYDEKLDAMMNEAAEFFEWCAFNMARRSADVPEVPESADDVDPYERSAIIAETAKGSDGGSASGETIAAMIRAWGAAAAKRAAS